MENEINELCDIYENVSIKLNNVVLPEDKSKYFLQARSFIKNCILSVEIDHADAESFIEKELKEKYNFKSIDVKNLTRYYNNLIKEKNIKSKSKTEEENQEESKKEHDIIDFDELDISEERQAAAKERALDIMKNDNPMQFVLGTIRKEHIGDGVIEEATCVSIAGQSCSNTDGIQIGINGEPGSGKSHSLKMHLLLIRKKHKIEASLSAKAMYYAPLKPGMIIFSDDTEPDEAMEQTIKRATTNYQETTEHRTVKDQSGLTLTIPPRINWFLTSVESTSSTQLLSRQFKCNTIETQQQKDMITQKQLENAHDARHGLTDVNDDVLTCRYIYDEIKSHVFKVTVPYAKRIKINDNRDARNTNMFLDMIKGYTIFNFMQRDTDEEGNLIATENDFYNACCLFNHQLETTVTKYTEKESTILKFLLKHPKSTIADIVLGTGIPDASVRGTLKGRKDRTSKGLLEKVKGLTVLRESRTVEEEKTFNKITTTADYYTLDRFDNVWDLFKSGYAELCDSPLY